MTKAPIKITDRNWEKFQAEVAATLPPEIQTEKSYNALILLEGLRERYEFNSSHALNAILNHYDAKLKSEGEPDLELQVMVDSPWSFRFSSFNRMMHRRKRTR